MELGSCLKLTCVIWGVVGPTNINIQEKIDDWANFSCYFGLFEWNLVFQEGSKSKCSTPVFQLVVSGRIYYSSLLGWNGLNFFLSKINSLLINLVSVILNRNKMVRPCLRLPFLNICNKLWGKDFLSTEAPQVLQLDVKQQLPKCFHTGNIQAS